MTRVPYVDLAAQHAELREELLQAVGRVVDHGGYILGPEVGELECALAGRLGVSEVVGVNSGTDALVLALRDAGVGAGDEVITVSHTFFATASAIRMRGATPVLVDVEDETMLMDPDAVQAAITPRTRAVVPVHLGGFAADLTRLSALCAEHDLALVEDAAQSLGATHAGRSVGSWGRGAFSLHPLKVLSAVGDAGFVALPERSERVRRWRNLGLGGRGVCAEVSGNSRLDTLHAAVLLVKLRRLDAWIAARRAHAAAYREALAGLVRLPPAEGDDVAVYSTFVIRHPARDALLDALQRRGIDAKVHYPTPVHRQPAFEDCPRGPLDVTERVVREIISLPVVPEIGLDGREAVIAGVQDAVQEVGRVGG